MFVELLRHELLAHTYDDAGCKVWKMSCCNGHPGVRIKGKSYLTRRVIWESLYGKIGNKVIHMTCESPKCVNPDHMAAITRKQLGSKMGALGKMSGHTRSANIAASRRKNAQLNIEAVREIRSSIEKISVLAKKHDVTESHISKIRNHKLWRDYTSPWAGL
jgi:hypothetical protein